MIWALPLPVALPYLGSVTRTRLLAIFALLALGGSAAIAFGFHDAWSTPMARALTIVHMMPVMLATLIVQGPLLRQPILGPLGLKVGLNRWWLAGWLGPVAVLALALLAVWILFGVEPVLDPHTFVANKRTLVPEADLAAFDAHLSQNAPPHPLWLVAQALPAGITLNLLVALATEIGWRGLLFREMPGGFWMRSFGIGLFEAVWFVPIVLLGVHFPDHRLEGAACVAVWCLVASPVLVYLRVRADSVLAVAAFRGTLLALTMAAADLAWGAEDWQRPFYGVAGILGMAVLLAGCWVHDRHFAAQRLMSAPAPVPNVPDREEE